MGAGFIVLRILLLMGASVSVGQSLNIKIFEECYGNMWDNYLTASCDTAQLISIISLKAFAKRLDTKCPQQETVQTPLPSDSCCRYNNSDCGDTYLGNGLAHYLSCNGRQNCNGIPIAWMNTPCKTGEYLNETNYMRMEYECIPSIGTADATNNTLITDYAVHIWNPKYPDGNTFRPGDTITCSVEASCKTRIVMTAIFLKFLQLQVVSGVCGQRVTIEDGMEKKEISCESNNNYTITDVYTSSSHFIKFTVYSNMASNRDWRFWFKFKGSQNDSQMTLGCGSQMRNSAQNPSPGNCSPMSTTPTLPTTPAPASKNRQNGTNSPDDTTILIAILVPLAVILIIATIVIILCCRENISRKCCYGQKLRVYPESVEDIFDVPVPHQKIAPIATTLGGDKKKSLIRRQTTHSLPYSNAEEAKGDERQRKLQLRKHASEMQLLKANGQKSPLQKRSFSSLHEKRSQLPAILGTADHEVDAELVEDEKAARKERKRRRKDKKRNKRESDLRLLEEEQQMNKMGYYCYVPNISETNPFRVAGHAANAFHPPVMRPYYPESGQENYYVPGHNMYDHQLPLAGSIYGYPVSQHQNLQNIPANGTASVRSTSIPVYADSNSREAYVLPTSLAGSFRGTPAQPISMTSSFRGASVQPSMSGSFRVPPIQRKPTLTGPPMHGGYYDEPITTGGSFHGGYIPMDGTFRGAPSNGSLRRHPSAMSVSQRAGESPLIFHTGQFEGQFVPQGSTYETYENPALSRWRAAGIAVNYATRPQTGGPSLEIGSIDNPNEREVSQVHEDSVV